MCRLNIGEVDDISPDKQAGLRRIDSEARMPWRMTRQMNRQNPLDNRLVVE